MIKREEIREGIDSILIDCHAPLIPSYIATAVTKKILKYLDSQGCVIRVENGEDLEGCCIARLEPLIRGE